MVWIQNADLTLTTVGTNTTVNVKYTALVNPLERHMCAKGMLLGESIAIMGMDPEGSYTGTIIRYFPTSYLPVTDGTVNQSIARNLSITVTRASLNEDTGLGDNDEIRCKIRIYPVYLPVEAIGWTDQEILVG